MKNITKIVLVLLVNVLWLADDTNAQEKVLKTLSLIHNNDSLSTNSLNNINNSAYDKIKRIFDKLVNARGDFRYRVPKIILRKEESRVASIDYDKLEIIVEEKAYNICKEFGDDALAFLLAHELTHYYEKHAWRNNFATDFSDLSIGKNLRLIQDQITNETEADYLGGFLSYSAGYGLFNKSDEILKKLYQAYNIPSIIPGYPSLEDRIELAKRSAKKLESLIEVFETANLLTAIGKFREAYLYYQYILMQYQSREIYNNLGTTCLMNALSNFKNEELKFRYVVELDLEARGARDTDSKKIRDSLLNMALKHFDAAIGMDHRYAPAYLNKASALALLGDTIRAAFYAEHEALKIALENNFVKTAIDAKILLGILKAKEGDSLGASKLFEQGIQQGSHLAKFNMDILNSVSTASVSEDQKVTMKFVPMDNVELRTFSRAPIFDNDKVITISPEYTFLQYNADSLSFKLFYNMNIDTRMIDYFMLTKSNCTVKSEKGIGIGSSSQELQDCYGQATQTIETPQGSIFVYDKLIFIIGKNHKVLRWGNYLSKKSLL